MLTVSPIIINEIMQNLFSDDQVFVCWVIFHACVGVC